MGENRQIYSRLKKLLNKNFIKIKKKKKKKKKEDPSTNNLLIHAAETFSLRRNEYSSERVSARIFFEKKKKERKNGRFVYNGRPVVEIGARRFEVSIRRERRGTIANPRPTDTAGRAF